jgi:hypothetical protein
MDNKENLAQCSLRYVNFKDRGRTCISILSANVDIRIQTAWHKCLYHLLRLEKLETCLRSYYVDLALLDHATDVAGTREIFPELNKLRSVLKHHVSQLQAAVSPARRLCTELKLWPRLRLLHN